jgi:16S rRNA (guanine527-N7)-methyltransferase
MQKKIREKPAEKVWAEFSDQEGVSGQILEKFKKYENILHNWNKVMNLTSVSGLSETVSRHFSDSLILRNFIDLTKVKLIVDVGSGAGFPGIPLKIMFPHLGMILMEVKRKRQSFLKNVIDELDLKDIEVCSLDWRTFLRKTESKPDYFIVRASIDPIELCRMFKPACPYKDSKVIYWAVEGWEPQGIVKKFILKEFEYKLKRKKRKLIVMGACKQ